MRYASVYVWMNSEMHVSSSSPSFSYGFVSYTRTGDTVEFLRHSPLPIENVKSTWFHAICTVRTTFIGEIYSHNASHELQRESDSRERNMCHESLKGNSFACVIVLLFFSLIRSIGFSIERMRILILLSYFALFSCCVCVHHRWLILYILYKWHLCVRLSYIQTNIVVVLV